MAGDPDPGLLAVVTQAKLDAGDAEATLVAVQKDGLAVDARTHFQPGVERDQSLAREIDDALCISLAAHPEAW